MATQAGTGTVHTRSRRKLNFGESQRFKGKTFFLDLAGYRRAKELEQELILRGATIEKFLDRKVRYLITNKSSEMIQKATTKVTSSQSPHTPSTGGLSQLISPLSNQSPCSANDKKTTAKPYYTRAQKMLQMSLEKKPTNTTTDILSLAASWKCKILHVDAVEKELKKLKTVGTKNEGPKKIIDIATVRKLQKPFFKVEDLSRQYRPIIYEPSCWPTVDSNCPPKACPFDHPRPDSPVDDSMPKKTREKVIVEEKKAGYCEPCAVRFDDLKLHLRSSQHQQFAQNPKNFEKLDKLIAQCTNFRDFLTQLVQQQCSSESPLKGSQSPLRKNGSTIYPERISMVSLPSKEGPIVLCDYPFHQSVDSGVCTRQMKRKLLESSPSLLTPDLKRARTSS